MADECAIFPIPSSSYCKRVYWDCRRKSTPSGVTSRQTPPNLPPPAQNPKSKAKRSARNIICKARKLQQSLDFHITSMEGDSNDTRSSESGRSSRSSSLDEGNGHPPTSSNPARVEPTKNCSASQVIKNADGSGNDFVPFVGYDFTADGGVEDYLQQDISPTKSGDMSNSEFDMDKIDDILNSIAGMTGKKRESSSHPADQIAVEEKSTKGDIAPDDNKIHETNIDCQHDEPKSFADYQGQDNEHGNADIATPEQEIIKTLDVVEDLQLDSKRNDLIDSNDHSTSMIKSINTPQEDDPVMEEDESLLIDQEVQAAGQSTDPYTPTRTEQNEISTSPDEWTTHWSQEHGCNYYHNTTTGQVTWEDPFTEKAEYVDKDYAPIADFTKEKVTIDTEATTIGEDEDLKEGRRSMASDLAYQRKKKLNKKRVRKRLLKRVKTFGTFLLVCFVFYFLWHYGVKNQIDEQAVKIDGGDLHLKEETPQERLDVKQDTEENYSALNENSSEEEESHRASAGELKETNEEEPHFETQTEVQRSTESHGHSIKNNEDNFESESAMLQEEGVPSSHQDSDQTKEERADLDSDLLEQESEMTLEKQIMDEIVAESSLVEKVTLDGEHQETLTEMETHYDEIEDAEIEVELSNDIEKPISLEETSEEMAVLQAEEEYIETENLAKELGMKLEESVALLRSSTAPDGSYESEDLDRLGSKLDELRAILHEVQGNEEGIKDEMKGTIPDNVVSGELQHGAEEQNAHAESTQNTITSTTLTQIVDDPLTEVDGIQGDNDKILGNESEINDPVEELSKLQSLLEAVEEDDSRYFVSHTDSENDKSKASTDDHREFIGTAESDDQEIDAAVEELSKLQSLLDLEDDSSDSVIQTDNHNDNSKASKDDNREFIGTEGIGSEEELKQDASEQDSTSIISNGESNENAKQDEIPDSIVDMTKLSQNSNGQSAVAKPRSDLENDDNINEMLSTFSSSVHELKLESMRRNLGEMKSSLAEDIGRERLEAMQSAIRVIKRAMIETIEDDIIELSDSLGLSALQNKQGFDEVADVISELTDVISDRRSRRNYALTSMKNTLNAMKDTVTSVSRKAVPSSHKMKPITSLPVKESLGSHNLFDKPEILFQRPISNGGNDDRVANVFSRRAQDRTRVSNLFNQMPEHDDTTRSLVFLDTRRIHCHFPLFHSMNGQCGDEVVTFRPQRLLPTLDPKLLLSGSQEKGRKSWDPQSALAPFNQNRNIIGMRRMALRGFKEFTQACSKARDLIPKKLGMIRSRVTEILLDNKLEDEDRQNLVCSIPLLHLVSKETERECKKKKYDSAFDIQTILDNTAL